jgi:hypothetical protein
MAAVMIWLLTVSTFPIQFMLGRIRISSRPRDENAPVPEYIPVPPDIEVDESNPALAAEVEGESWEMYVQRRTREFNILLRERKGDPKIWIEYANFQEEAVAGPQKPGGVPLTGRIAAGVAEKQMAILERGVKEYPASTELVKEYLEVCEKVVEYVSCSC